LDRFSNILKQRLETTQSVQAAHPSADTLVAFVEQGLTGSQREAVLEHLSVCPECRQAMALATPETATVNVAATRAVSPMLHYPAAMRWASLAAALAVAVGVGVIAYEHEAGPIQRQAMVSSISQEQKANVPVASSMPTANEETAPSNLKSAASQAQSHSSIAEKREVRRERSVAKKEMPPKATILGTLSAKPSQTESNSRYALKTLPAAPEVHPMIADKRDAVETAPAASAPASAESVAVSAENSKDLDSYIASAKPSTGSSTGGVVGGVAGTNFVPNQPAPAKALNTVSLPGAKAKVPYGVLAFVHWTISTAGKLQRRAIDGTLTIVEPVPGAIIRAVAAEGIEVWAGGSRSVPTPKNALPRSVLFHSSDAGETWNTIDGPWQGSITRVNLAGLGSLTVVATDGSWSTGDGGKSWSKP